LIEETLRIDANIAARAAPVLEPEDGKQLQPREPRS
jgi:hypothetical protein